MIDNINWQTRAMYMLIIVFMLLCSVCFSQIKVIQFNAGWNKSNDVPWVMSLKDCKTIGYTDVGSDKKAQTKYKIASVPTIIIFKDGEEVKRFQADISFSMKATLEDVQEVVDDSNMDSF